MHLGDIILKTIELLAQSANSCLVPASFTEAENIPCCKHNEIKLDLLNTVERGKKQQEDSCVFVMTPMVVKVQY